MVQPFKLHYNEVCFGDQLAVIDLKKAYDSVPRDALWTVLVNCVVPP